MMSTILIATIVNKGRKDRKTNMEIKKPHAVGHYSMFIKGVERPDQYVSHRSVLKKTKMFKEGGTVSAKLCPLQRISFLYRILNTNKVKYKNFLHELRRSWMSEVQNRSFLLLFFIYLN
jgi:hypothetical protein